MLNRLQKAKKVGCVLIDAATELSEIKKEDSVPKTKVPNHKKLARPSQVIKEISQEVIELLFQSKGKNNKTKACSLTVGLALREVMSKMLITSETFFVLENNKYKVINATLGYLRTFTTISHHGSKSKIMPNHKTLLQDMKFLDNLRIAITNGIISNQVISSVINATDTQIVIFAPAGEMSQPQLSIPRNEIEDQHQSRSSWPYYAMLIVGGCALLAVAPWFASGIAKFLKKYNPPSTKTIIDHGGWFKFAKTIKKEASPIFNNAVTAALVSVYSVGSAAASVTGAYKLYSIFHKTNSSQRKSEEKTETSKNPKRLGV